MSLSLHSVSIRLVGLSFILAAFLPSHSLHAQSLYKSIGPNGKVIYSAHPPEGAKVAKKLEFADLPASRASAYTETPAKVVTLPEGDVVLYAADWCGYCRKAKAYMDGKGISYKEVNIESEFGKNAFAQVNNGNRGIPLLLARGQRIQGYSEDAYDALFK